MPQPNASRDFFLVYVLLSALRTLPRLNRKVEAKLLLKFLVRQGKNTEVFKQAVFAVTLPRVYALWNRQYSGSILPAVLSSPLLHLVEPSLRRTLAVYVATTAAVNFKRSSKRRQILPPTWTLILPANSWLLWASVFRPHCFPRGYGDIIYSYSGYGSDEPMNEVIEFLQQTKFECHPPGILSSQSSKARKIHPAHTRAVCSRLHPQTPSCIETYIKAWITQFPRVFKWVGSFGAFTLLLFKRQKLRESPLNVFMDWIVSSLRGTVFIVGSINTCWGLTCLFQRILRPGSLPRLRWFANGLLGNLWVLALAPARRTDFALYSTRLAVTSCWDLFDLWSPIYGEAMVLALSWASLLRDRQIGRGPRGLAGMVLNYIDAHTSTKT